MNGADNMVTTVKDGHQVYRLDVDVDGEECEIQGVVMWDSGEYWILSQESTSPLGRDPKLAARYLTEQGWDDL